MRRTKSVAMRYALGALAAVAALLLRKVLDPLLGQQNPYHTMWLAVVFSAWYCGIWASVVTVGVGAVGLWYWFLPPLHAFAGKDGKEIFGMLGFLVFSAVVVALGESSRRISVQRDHAEDSQRRAHEELEERVRRRTAELEKQSAELIEKATLLDLANDGIFVKNAKGIITYWNEGAERLYGWRKEEALGRASGDILRTVFPVPAEEIESRDLWEGELLHTRRDGRQILVASRWTRVRDAAGNLAGWLEINTDITQHKATEEASRKLSSRLLTLQDEERRRIARELHDSLGQYLTFLKISLDLLAAAGGKPAAVAAECSEIVEKCLTETRTISHLLHPPLLDESGLVSAARWYVEGFAKRSGIEVELELPAEPMRLPHEIELALFRAVQEALTNVHRHADSSLVKLSLRREAQQVRLAIQDNGKGIPKERLNALRHGGAPAGVGLAGMRERVRELGGSLEVRSNGSGTTLIVTTPVRVKRPPGAEAGYDPPASLWAG